jgi:phospholipid/cholesterol/gamma-HCH transport system substrate-binding protein
MLERLTKDADTVLTAWARKSKETANFFVQSRIAARATAEERVDFERNFQKFPAFLRQLRPFMQRFGALSEAMAPVISDLRASAPDLSRFLVALGPFSRSSTAALKTLGQTADIGRPILVNAKPVAERIAEFTSRGRKVVRNLSRLFTSIDQHKGIERLMDTLFYITMSTNGFDELGHYLRNALIVTACAAYATTHAIACTANFDRPAAAASAFASANRPVSWTVRQLTKALGRDRNKDKARKSRASDKAAPDSAPERKAEPAPAPNGGDTPGGGNAPQPDSPAAGSPDQGQAPQPRDPLLNYLLGDG